MNDETVIITDGSAHMHGGGGWCAIIRTPTTVTELTGWVAETTSNRMEMQAAIEGLRELKVPTKVTLVSDSAYLLNSLKNNWYVRWFQEIPRSKRRPNMDLWWQLAGLVAYHDVSYVKVKGHSGDYWNSRADKLASAARKEQVSLRVTTPIDESIHGNSDPQSYALLT